MKVSLINGSPKGAKSASKLIIEALQGKLSATTSVEVLHVALLAPEKIIAAATGSDAIVFVFPLYVDSIPSHVLRFLDESGQALAEAAPAATVYAISNNGFYDGHQNTIALEIMQNFCTRSGFTWGGGIGVGAGAMVGPLEVSSGGLKPLDNALTQLASNIEQRQTAPNAFPKPNLPRFLYKFSAHREWRKIAKQNGLREQQLFAEPSAPK
jgi:multimeric flavodoxin WrbA